MPIRVRFLFLSLFLIGSLDEIQAQTVRTFVSTSGSDLNPCSRSPPCRIVEAHGGKMTVVSEEGKGSTFTVALPLRVTSQVSPVSSEVTTT